MSDQPAADQVVVPVKMSAPEEGGPPTLAQPASGPVAEMSGAIPQDAPKPAEPVEASTAEVSTGVNGDPAPVAQTIEKPSEEKPVVDEPAPVAPEEPAEDKPAEEKATTANADTEMTDAAPTAVPETNGTPAAKPQPKRKSSTGVPEHKSKTLKKKQSKAKITNLDAKPGDLYLARLRSYPPWPSIIADEEMLPDVLLTTRPVTAQQEDGTYKEAYADGGKKVADRTYPVMFLYTNEFAWIPNTDLTSITPEECKEVPEKGKAKALIGGYQVAAENHDLAYFKQMLGEHAAAMEEDAKAKADQEEQKAAEKAAKSDKKKRKSEVKATEDVEMEDAVDAPKKGSKKRKKDAESDDEEQPEKPAKTPKTTKIKLTTGKTPTTDKKTEKKPSKPKSEKKKKAADSEEEAEPEKEPAPPADPVQERKDREKEVLFHRHKLQKGFLTRDQMPAESEMPQMAIYFKKLEAYGDKLEVTIIRSTKINKVLKGIVKLNTIPRDEEFHFRERSVALLGIWNQLLGAEPSDEKPAKDDKASPVAANGVHKESEEKAEEKIEPEVAEPKENTLPAEEAVNKISAEVPVDAGIKAAAIEAVSEEEKPAEQTKVESANIPETEKAPESAAAAAEATEVVKAAE